MGLSAEQEREIEAYLDEVNRVLHSLTDPEKAALTVTKLRQRIQTALANGYASRDEAVRVLLERLGDPIRLGVRLARTWGSEETGPQPPELPAVIREQPATDADAPDPRGTSRAAHPIGEADEVPAFPAGLPEVPPKPTGIEKGHELPSDRERRRTRSAVWLGLCAWLSNQQGVPVWICRPMLALVGLMFWPVALPLYMLAYGALRAAGKDVPRGEIRILRLMLDLLTVGGLCVLLYATGFWAMRGMDWASMRYLDHPMLDRLGSWNWLEPWQHMMLATAVAYAAPPTILAAMPVSDGWSSSLRRFALALAALYGLAVSAGLASLIAGSAVQMSQLLMGK